MQRLEDKIKDPKNWLLGTKRIGYSKIHKLKQIEEILKYIKNEP